MKKLHRYDEAIIECDKIIEAEKESVYAWIIKAGIIALKYDIAEGMKILEASMEHIGKDKLCALLELFNLDVDDREIELYTKFLEQCKNT